MNAAVYGARQAQGIPSVESCTLYAEADAAYSAVEQPARKAGEAALQPAEQAWVTAYFASYDNDGGTRSEVPDVMGKLIDHHRQLCTELYGL